MGDRLGIRVAVGTILLRTVRNRPFLNIWTHCLHFRHPGKVLEGFRMRNGCPKREPIFRVFRAKVRMTHRPPTLRTALTMLFLNILTSSLHETTPGKVPKGFQMINGYPKREPIFPYFGPVTGRPPVLRTARNSPFLNIGTSSLR